jgi:glycerol-3-phosphate dehydrogenase (NAD(P)+)
LKKINWIKTNMDHIERVGIVGSGSWATALVKLLLNNVKEVNWYVRNRENIEYMRVQGHNPNYLSAVSFDTSRIHFHDKVEETVMNSDILYFAIPAAFLKETLSEKDISFKGKFIVSAIKGIVPGDFLTIAEYFNKYHQVGFNEVAILSGPCHAEEVALERLSYLTIASKSLSWANHIASQIACRYIKTIPSHDVYGTEYAAVLKNIFAIATGICHGLGYGDNFIAVLMSSATREMKRFLDKTYPSKRKITHSAYLGDLLVTGYSQFSRNRTFGMMIGKGYSTKFAQMEMNMIAEGYYASACIKEINKKHNVKMPIADAVYNILYEKISPAIEIKLLTDKLL